ncbi:TPM domain-containing protein [Desulfovibrio sulfodismutans]|uniref:TPM domain-containing protein n=1 Tax=Desulfolutivibrio sulfodismutans TaxID=63561 RepID=A0A7K3NLW2_9BACT|nr:TPM domain-containing protein [Desulfolutivibrio sulfodismutans]NDY57184.1 TPM domain-containing protein [Desulfolutivibrio sulfodismutans]QLA11824.1 TPM domain-containing protein [Desulfolutivibrio sulfodismutans DSM 3696]
MSFFRMSSRAGSPLERFLRGMALLAVIAGVLWAFEARFSHLAERLESQQAISDETGGLSDGDRRFLRQAAEDLRMRFGLELRVRVAAGELTVPELDEKTVFFGLSPADKAARVILPPLAARALGPDFVKIVENDMLAAALSAGQWPKGLCAAVVFLERQLSEPRTGEK